MLDKLFSASTDQVLLIIVATLGVFLTVITYTRVAGLRSFSKMSGFDFAMTIAVGSLMATVALTKAPLIQGMVALAVLYFIQVAIALLRKLSFFKNLVDNQPLLLMDGSRMLYDNMSKARVTETDITSKLREANVKDLSTVRAVVLETTGDISVLHGEGPIDPALLGNVRGTAVRKAE